jgi:benzoyl-CoA reductase/2-hydroxyglutaryl-CoA dehydratase subunit BcrC/BadD/HgdB
MTSPNQFTYPDEIKTLLMETADLIMGDGRKVTPAEIWDYMTRIAPARYPFAFNNNIAFAHRLSEDVYLMSGIKRAYMEMTGTERIETAKSKGTPLVIIQGGYTFEPYYAAGCMPVGPIFPRNWLMYLKKGEKYRSRNNRSMRLMNESRVYLDVESCNLVASVVLLKNHDVPVDMVAPCLCSRCSDMAYVTEAYATGKKNLHGTDIPTFMMDYPVNNRGSEWRVTYLEEELRSLVEKLSTLSGKDVTDEDLRAEIRKENRARQLIRECQKIWWDAVVPPTNSKDNSLPHFGVGGSFDFTAAIQILEESKAELSDRVKKGITGFGLDEDPARLFVCGSCVNPNPAFVDAHGGVVVGKDDIWSTAATEVKETGDPYRSLAESTALLPYERSTEERAKWTIKQVKDSRADGVVFLYNWGCNYQSAISAMITDIIKEQTGISTACIEVGELTRLETIEQSQNRIEAFLEMIR